MNNLFSMLTWTNPKQGTGFVVILAERPEIKNMTIRGFFSAEQFREL
jgi:hypothetical protein